MSTRLVLDEFYIDLSPLAPWLVVIVIVVVACGADARTLHAAVCVAIAVAGRKRVVLRRGRLLGVGISNISHDVGFEMGLMVVFGVAESQRGILLMDLLLEVRNRQMVLFEKGVGCKVTGEALGFADRENRLKRGRTCPRNCTCPKRHTKKGKRERESGKGQR